LEWTVAWLARFGINELVVNLHYLPGVVPAYFGDGERWGVRMTYSHEEEILGTAGAVRRVKDQFTEPFLVWYGDNLSNIDLPRLLKEHEEHGGIGTISLSWLDDPTMSGIVSVDENQRIERFLEKPRPEQVFSHWVNAGVYILDPAIFDYIPGTESPDFGKDVFPAVLACGQALFGYRFSPREKLWLIDTPNKLESVTSDPAVEAAFQ
jgi:NDP-sugar pyrophosphorylase family protein